MVMSEIFLIYLHFFGKKGEKVKEVIINKNDAGQRLDKFLKKYMPKLPSGMLYKGIRKNTVRINGKHAKNADVFLVEGDVLKLYFNDEFFSKRNNIKKAPYPEICYEDDNILILNKPCGIPVHGDDKGTELTLVSEVLYYLYEKGEYNPDEEKSFSPALCNRLDRNTSGLVIAAKNAKALRFINEKIKKREIKKYYICIIEGKLKERSGTFYARLERSDKKVTINENNSGKEIVTGYEVLDENDNFSLVQVELITGRTHQIRAHFAHLGHPLRGDTKYGAKKDKRFKYQALSSFLLRFDFLGDNGEFEYLNGMEFKIKPPFSL